VAEPAREPAVAASATPATSWPDPQWTDVLPPPVEPATEEPAPEEQPPDEVRYPIPPAARSSAPDANLAFGTPATALRMARPITRTPQAVSDLVIDPMSLRARLRLHAGLTALTIDERRLTLRIRLKRTRIPWSDVLGFQPHYEAAGAEGVTRGSVIALTTTGHVELPATRGSIAEVRYAQAMLDAYRIRAQLAQHN
jgi:hypothetical protein